MTGRRARNLSVEYATATCAREGRDYAVVWHTSERHIVCWCASLAEAQRTADRLNARTANRIQALDSPLTRSAPRFLFRPRRAKRLGEPKKRTGDTQPELPRWRSVA